MEKNIAKLRERTCESVIPSRARNLTGTISWDSSLSLRMTKKTIHVTIKTIRVHLCPSAVSKVY
jgi:hypothetical protein